MSTCRIELGISPLSSPEADRALAALCKAWCQPAWVRRQSCGDAWLLAVRHEADLRPGESPRWFAERIAAALWLAVGRYVCITLDITPENEESHRLFEYTESDYWCILRDFRLSPADR